MRKWKRIKIEVKENMAELHEVKRLKQVGKLLKIFFERIELG